MQINSLGDVLRHFVNRIPFDNETDYRAAHAFIDDAYPVVEVVEAAPAVEATTVEAPAEAEAATPTA